LVFDQSIGALAIGVGSVGFWVSARYPSRISQSLKHTPPVIARAPWSDIRIVTASSGSASINEPISPSSMR
jgi:hypothetical protein